MVKILAAALVVILPTLSFADISMLEKVKQFSDGGTTNIKLEQYWKSPSREPGLGFIYTQAQAGNPQAENLMGCVYYSGKWGVKKSSDRAFGWFQKAEQKSPVSRYNLGLLYALGQYPHKQGEIPGANMEKAEPYFIYSWKSAHVPQAAIRLAYWYYVKKDYKKAWDTAQSCSKVYPKHCKYLIGKMELDGTSPSGRNAYAALNTLFDSVETFNPNAAALLSWMYGSGAGADKNIEMAYAYDVIRTGIATPSAMNAVVSAWSIGLSDSDRQRGEAYGKNWLRTHDAPPPMDFINPLSGY